MAASDSAHAPSIHASTFAAALAVAPASASSGIGAGSRAEAPTSHGLAVNNLSNPYHKEAIYYTKLFVVNIL